MSQARVPVRLALAQLRVDPGQRDATLARALQRIEMAADEGANIVLLPEALPLGWMAADTRAGADAVPDGATCTAFRDAAARHRVFVCTGIVERYGDAIFNAAVLIDPD